MPELGRRRVECAIPLHPDFGSMTLDAAGGNDGIATDMTAQGGQAAFNQNDGLRVNGSSLLFMLHGMTTAAVPGRYEGGDDGPFMGSGIDIVLVGLWRSRQLTSASAC